MTEPTGHLTEAQLLMMASVINKVAQVEQRLPAYSHGNGNGKRWERYALSLLSAIAAGLSIWLWDVRMELTQVSRTQAQRTSAIAAIEQFQRTSEERAARMATIEAELKNVNFRVETHAQGQNARLDSLAQRLMQINNRLDQQGRPRFKEE